MSKTRLSLLLVVLLVLGLFNVALYTASADDGMYPPDDPFAPAGAPIYGSTVIPNGDRFLYIRVSLNDPRTSIRMLSASNDVPAANSIGFNLGTWLNPGSPNHGGQTLLTMYNNYTSGFKVGAINGDFFTTNQVPIGEFIRNGTKYAWNDGAERTSFRIYRWNGSRYPLQWAHPTQNGYNITSAYTSIGGTNVMAKHPTTGAWVKGYFSQSRFNGDISRSAVCATSAATGSLFFIVTANGVTATGAQLTQAFDNLGCTNAMEFDGGTTASSTSATLVYQGVQKAGTSRSIGNGLIVIFNPEQLTGQPVEPIYGDDGITGDIETGMVP